ncbi:ketopantoate hydroxymethyltransferase [Xylophilus ampelinus]|uniref:3-methyl-2-oxobutanoate hydroxymethyltransferase n=2 Tax=Xylophilus ampelinus TaxID=54067 RepID=A0A318SQW0_9BURK|nr:ketopantoate hydroxymethyltransferase [Xylophilus ampelinus]
MTSNESAPYGAPTPARSPTVSVLTLHDMKARREKITMLTAYDSTFAHAASNAGIDCLLVGDSLGMVCKGDDSTLSVTLSDIGYHTRSVARGIARAGRRPLLVADMPFGSYQTSREEAFRNAAELMCEGAHMVKLEGGGWVCAVVEFLVARGIPVCAHLGLTPQSVHALGGYRVQGRTREQADTLIADARRLESSGATMLVLEVVPADLSRDVTQDLQRCATIGIGAGSGTDGQVLVLHDMLGLSMGRTPRFVADFLQKGGSIDAAMQGYVEAVKSGAFPVDALHAW